MFVLQQVYFCNTLFSRGDCSHLYVYIKVTIRPIMRDNALLNSFSAGLSLRIGIRRVNESTTVWVGR